MTEAEKQEVRKSVEDMLRNATCRWSLARPVKDTTPSHPDSLVTGETRETLFLVLVTGPKDISEDRVEAAIALPTT